MRPERSLALLCGEEERDGREDFAQGKVRLVSRPWGPPPDLAQQVLGGQRGFYLSSPQEDDQAVVCFCPENGKWNQYMLSNLYINQRLWFNRSPSIS